MAVLNGKTYMFGGDTFGAEDQSHWRSNVLFVIEDDDPSDRAHDHGRGDRQDRPGQGAAAQPQAGGHGGDGHPHQPLLRERQALLHLHVRVALGRRGPGGIAATPGWPFQRTRARPGKS